MFYKAMSTTPKVQKSEAEWREELSPEQYYVLREKGTERPFTGEYVDARDSGQYLCAACGEKLFDAATQYDSHCGWPSFTAPSDDQVIDEHKDVSHGMIRTEVTCANCGGHLGHVFNDGPGPTGLRYCINSISIEHKDQ